jgi:hypothetical protein
MRRVVLLCAAVGVVFAGVVGSALGASTVSLCVPSGEGAAITTPSKGSCGSGITVKLPSEAKEQEKLISVLPHINYEAEGIDKKPTIQFSGANLQVIDGSGSETTVNGTGNLILGYDEKAKTQTGSHNLLVGGVENSYSSYGGILGGAHNNTINGPYASVLGGAENTATGSSSAITGGHSNKTSASYSTINGGCGNFTGSGTFAVSSTCTTAYANDFTTVNGGAGNQAEAENSSVSGGAFNLANGLYTSITGGCSNLAGTGTVTVNADCTNTTEFAGDFGAVTGGAGNHTTGIDAAITGGESNAGSGPLSAISGGLGNTNSGTWSSISGGEAGTASGGDASAISGGYDNKAAGDDSSISGGVANSTSGTGSIYGTAVSGGDENSSSAFASSVSGGVSNAASGNESSVLGGTSHTASTTNSVAGALSNLSVVRGETEVSAGSVGYSYADCPTGEIATGGGIGAAEGGNSTDRVLQSGPTASDGLFVETTTGSVPVDWYGSYLNGGSSSETFYTWALCSP